jgi:hypothetical protein
MDIDILSASARDSLIGDFVRHWLEPLGLRQAAPRRWVDGSKAPVRKLFELQLLKGATFKACWGFSLDFVPGISGRTIRWHRSDKAAMLDVIVDPQESHRACFLYGPARFRSDLNALFPSAVAGAVRDWKRGATYVGMLELILDIRHQRTNCFDYHNYTQLPLAFAFLSARVGNLPVAERELEEYLSGRRLPAAEVAKFQRLLREYEGPCLDPSWLTSTIVFLAQAIYDDRAFDRLPILADALEDAGCTNADILEHCRQPGEHGRGCWVVNLLTGRE